MVEETTTINMISEMQVNSFTCRIHAYPRPRTDLHAQKSSNPLVPFCPFATRARLRDDCPVQIGLLVRNQTLAIRTNRSNSISAARNV